MQGPPQSESELLARSRDLDGMKVGTLARRLGRTLSEEANRGKGQVGELLELALGATAGNQDLPDFIDLGIELKTVPVDLEGSVRESTYVCFLDLSGADHEEWETSRVRRKLQRVLWIPVEWRQGLPREERHLGTPLLWSPSRDEEALLRGDWMDLMGKIATGGIDEITAHLGRALQIRPKAANAAARTEARGPEGEILSTVPRGFYLRTWFTERILWGALG